MLYGSRVATTVVLGLALMMTMCRLLPAQTPVHATHINPNTGFENAMFVHGDDDSLLAISEYGSYSRSNDGGRNWQVIDQTLVLWRPTAVEAEGNLVAVAGWSFAGNGVHMRVSADRGQTWQPEVVVQTWPPGPTGTEIGMHIDGNTISVFWTIRQTSALYVSRSTDGGQTFASPPVLLGAAQMFTSASYTMFLSVVAEGPQLRVFWLSHPVIAPAFGQLQVSDDGGQTWLTTPRSTPAPAPTGLPFLVGNPDLLLLGNMGSQLQSSTDSGLSWATVPGIAANSVHDITVQGQRVVATFETPNPVVFLTSIWTVQTSLDGAQTWQAPPTQISAPSGFIGTPHIVGDDLYVVFANAGQPSLSLLAYSGDLGLTWNSMDTESNAIASDPRRNVHFQLIGQTGELFAYVGIGWTPLGLGTAGTGNAVPDLGLSEPPVLGRTVSMDVTNARGGSLGVLGITWQQPAPVPFAGGWVWLQGPLVLSTFSTSGSAGAAGVGVGASPLTIPNSPTLVGARLTAQAAVLDPQATAGLALTHGIELWMR